MGSRRDLSRLIGLLFALGVLALSTGCRGRDTGTAVPEAATNRSAEGPTMNNDAIKLALSAEPLELSMGDRRAFKLTVAATNQGEALADPRFDLTRLLVNNQPSMAWNLAVSNGVRPAAWSALPSGKTVSADLTMLGEALFPAPGEYTLVLERNGVALAPIRVRVIP
jgi:hypothetical protein